MMKQIIMLFVFIFSPFIYNTQAQTTIDFNVDADWTASSSGGYTSYQTNHSYSQSEWTFTGGPALRQSTTIQDGEPATVGNTGRAWRIRDNSSASFTATHNTCGTLTQFGFDVRRWDGSPSPNFVVQHSANGGSTYSSTIVTINNTYLGNSSVYKTFSYSIPVANQVHTSANQFIVRVEAAGSTERIMIDNFTFTKATVDNSTGVSNTAVSSGSSTISWTNPATFNNIIVVASLSSITTAPADCVDPTSWVASSDWNSPSSVSSQMGSGSSTEYVVYRGTGTSVTLTNLPSTGILHYKVFTQLNPWSDGVSGNTALPVDLVSFGGEVKNNIAELKWVTASEVNNSHFEILKSKDGMYFEQIGSVSGAGTTNSYTDYAYSNVMTGTKEYYQLKQVDFDGKFEYSNVISLGESADPASIIKDQASSIKIQAEGETEIVILNKSGSIIYQNSVSENIILYKNIFPRGLHIIKVQNADNFELIKWVNLN
ncbi:MAG: hypothetical protein HOI49_01650 [Bacteroidetes bacterium]|nr:hypothetical protein [Bacteroidota bacterium]